MDKEHEKTVTEIEKVVKILRGKKIDYILFTFKNGTIGTSASINNSDIACVIGSMERLKVHMLNDIIQKPSKESLDYMG